MAYNAVAQAELDTLSDDAHRSTIHGSPSPPPGNETLFQPLAVHFDNLGGSAFREDVPAEASGTRDISGMLRSFNSNGTSYDMLEDDDYEQADDEVRPRPLSFVARGTGSIGGEQGFQEHPENLTDNATYNATASSDHEESILVSNATSPELPVRTVSLVGSIPLRHPTPDLQSLQGAYIGNVERLEQSAERLSINSDLGEELRKMKVEQKLSESRRSSMLSIQTGEEILHQRPIARQYSTGSVSKSIVGMNNAARSGGYSPGGYVISPKGSIRSGSYTYSANRGRSTSRGSRLTQVSEPEQEGEADDYFGNTFIPTAAPPVPPHEQPLRDQNGVLHAILPYYDGRLSAPFEEGSNQGHVDPSVGPIERSATAASTDTLQQANHLFLDFDGVHRSGTTASTDTFQQARSLFRDFDGVHYLPPTREPSLMDPQARNSRRISTGDPHRRDRPVSYADPPPGYNMIYYPAPVPAMLNLPQRLSKLPSAALREKRRTKVLDALPPENRKSAHWEPGLAEVEHGEERDTRRKSADPLRRTNNLTDVPPQLRASAFFDQPAERQVVEVKQDSAVATLDSILEASAFAPVSAFTDHPIVGHVGGDVYRKQANRKSVNDLLSTKAEVPKNRDSLNLMPKRRQSSGQLQADRGNSRLSLNAALQRATIDSERPVGGEGDEVVNGGEGIPLRASQERRRTVEGVDEGIEEEEDNEEGANEDLEATGEEPEYFGAPTTLLAELQLRKQQQKQRTRTAATAYPNGMHSTLLELDAVAQVQKKSRQNKRVTLAWEDPSAAGLGSDDEGDDDVPLGILFPGREGLINEGNQRGPGNRPLGLMESREIEDNEPLSRRRARLRSGAVLQRELSPVKRVSTMYQLEVEGVPDSKEGDVDDVEGETLAQRTRRLKAAGDTSISRPVSRALSSDFASELMSQFGVDEEDKTKGKHKQKDPELEPEEETLGQRRKRLQAERHGKSRDLSGGDASATQARPLVKTRHSMADILQAHPAYGTRQASRESLPLPSSRIPQQMPARGVPSGAYRYMPSGLIPGAATSADLNPFQGGIPPANMATGYGYSNGMVYSNPLAYTNPAIKWNMGISNYPGPVPYAAGFPPQGSTSMLQLGLGQVPLAALDPGQRDVIDRWRQSVNH
ncbi:MAG: hypothetical protein M1827_003145 [Pycnora praestabilis]|nr:MAG: hypothetical protein M1827_003145 [Pycnora praestabilis]